MDFLEIFSLGVAYRYAVKIEHKFNKQGSGLKIRHNRIMLKENLTHGTKDKARKANLKRDNPRQMERRVMESLRKTLDCGVSSKTTPRTTRMNVAQNCH
jgi:hypothetical protein